MISWLFDNLWPFLLGGLAVLGSQMLGFAAKDLYNLAKRVLWPPPPRPVEVSPDYAHPDIPRDECSWFVEHRAGLRMNRHYELVPHHDLGGPVFYPDSQGFRMFLMRKPQDLRPSASDSKE